MSIKKVKKIIYLFYEGSSERNYFEALKGNKFILANYTLKFHPKAINDLNNAINKSKSMEERFQHLKGIDSKKIFVYDSDLFKNNKQVSQEIIEHKNEIYFNEEAIEDFLKCHKARPIYKNQKPNLSRHIINEIKEMDINFITESIKKPKQFKDFKSVYDLLIELFEEKL